MKKFSKKDYLFISILFGFILGFVFVLRLNGLVLGSHVDWISQHITIPKYFRTMFYENGKLLPLFNLNIGMGQNIFYFAYYGLLNPIILISYLLPFMEMSTYIQISSIICMMINVILIYKWINNKYNRNVAFLAAITLTLAGPLLFHSHRHIMYVNYMPFLLWALISVDNYFSQRKRVALILSTFFLIMTNFYFSVPSIVVIGIYTLYKILKNNKKFKIKTFDPLFKVVFFVTIAILLSGIILLPTIYTLMNGRLDTSVVLGFKDLFFAKIDYKLSLYAAYGLGLTFIYIVALTYAFLSKKKENIFLGIILTLCICIPFTNYLLNGFMYIDGKCFIPFIPIAILLISYFVNDLYNNKIDIKKLRYTLIPISIITLYAAYNTLYITLVIADILLCFLTLFLIEKIKKTHLIYIPVIIIGFISFTTLNYNDDYVSIQDLNKENNSIYKELLNLTEDKYARTSIYDNPLNKVNNIYSANQFITSIYSSVYNKGHLDFDRNIFQNEIIHENYHNITQTSNLLFNIYSGTKYLIAENPLLGYELIGNIDDLSLYKNDDVLPIGYSSSKIMSLREFDTLAYPYNVDALLNYVIVDKSLDNVYKSNIEEIVPNYELTNYQNLYYEYKDGVLHIDASNDAKAQITFNNNLKDDILILSFTMNKEKQGYWCRSDITINNVTNSLSCSSWKYHNQNYNFTYTLSPTQKFNTLDITFSKGEYEIDDIKIYKMNYQNISNLKDNISEFIIDENLSEENFLNGNINVKEDGYLKLTIPYEKKGFSIWLDDNKITPTKVDKAFIGFEITQGYHNIKIQFVPPYLKLGIASSIVGLILLLLTYFYYKLSKQIDYAIEKSKRLLYVAFKNFKQFTIIHKGYIYLFLSLIILDIALRSFYFKTINFYHPIFPTPNLFSILWIGFIIYLTRNLNNKLGKSIYIIFFIFSLLMFIVHAVYYSYFQSYFDYEVLKFTGEGVAYMDTVLLNIKWWVLFTTITSVYFSIKGLKSIHHAPKVNSLKIILIIITFLSLHYVLPFTLGSQKQVTDWDDWRNPRKVYDSFNDNNKSMMVSGMFEYNFRDFYVTFMRNNKKITEEELSLLEENFNNAELNKENNYTGIFEGKNLILLQLESIDSFLLTEKIMPNAYNMMKNSINFSNHYSFTSGGGSTFNSEFMVNTGYSTAYNYNQNAYAFSRNNYKFSLPNLFKDLGYTANAFHMNSSEYYSRGVNYKAFGYNNYYGLKDQKIYQNNEFWLDRELINNNLFKSEIIQNNSLSYIITYTAHMPYKTSKGNCPMLTEEKGLTEFECLKIQAAETDNFIGLLLKELKNNNMLDNTVIAVFADHYVYTLEDKSLLDKYKETKNNLINHTPFFIWDNGEHKKTIKSVNSQLDILPTLLNLFGISYYPNYYLGSDILDPKFEPIVFFSDGSWYNGSTYVANGEYQFGKKLNANQINQINTKVKRKMSLNDAVMKSNYFNNILKES